jgi:hypothetical protein
MSLHHGIEEGQWYTEKILPRHWERLAVVYVRQSTMQQVLAHQESTRLHYGLVRRAVAWGWPAARVLVIDDDLGRSGTSAEGRQGLQRLVAEVGLDHVGLILGVEMSMAQRSRYSRTMAWGLKERAVLQKASTGGGGFLCPGLVRQGVALRRTPTIRSSRPGNTEGHRPHQACLWAPASSGCGVQPLEVCAQVVGEPRRAPLLRGAPRRGVVGLGGKA